ncbi:MAG: glycoside hydrolase family 3 C-terminal domain-containing protein [Eubacterium sp.]
MDASLAKKIRRKLSMEQLASLCSGANNWETEAYEECGIEKVVMSDGPHGLRVEMQESENKLGMGSSAAATCFPPAVLSACSFDEDLILKMAKAIAIEAKAAGVDLILGPGLNIKRSPLCGRNFEYFSEDPYLSGHLAKAFVWGAKEENVGTTLKHFLANNQETRRMVVDAKIDERALREIYLRGFEIAVKESNPMAMMCAYNSINGEFLSQNKRFLTDILRSEWGFDGIVMTDWGAVYDRVKGVKAGLDLEMPGSGGVNDAKIVKAIRQGHLKKTKLNEMSERLITFSLQAKENREAFAEKPEIDKEAHHQLARQIAAESMVLLKNDDQCLPIDLKKIKTVAMIGKMAYDPRYQGSGSSKINPYRIDDPYDALIGEIDDCVNIQAVQGYSDSSNEKHQQMIDEAVKAAKLADIALLFAGLPDADESEGYDRDTMNLPKNQREMIAAVCTAQPNTVLILANGGAVDLSFADQPKAILETWLGGQAMGSAVADILLGKVNPSGKLAETIPMRLEDTPSYINFPGTENTVNYGESIFVGYRYYDFTHKEVRYPFGYGLSYTTFKYDQLSIEKENEIYRISFQITNTGCYDGKEAVQLYTGKKDSLISRPIRELKGFKKIALTAGETKTVQFELNEDAFAYYNPTTLAWTLEEGDHTVYIGASSRDILLEGSVSICGSQPKLTYYSSIGDLAARPRGQQVIQAIKTQFEEMSGQTVSVQDEFFMTFIKGTPLIKAIAASRGLLTKQAIDRILDFVNGVDDSESFDCGCLFEEKEQKKSWLQALIENFFGPKGNINVYNVDDRVRDLMDNTESRNVLEKYCPTEYLNSDIMKMVMSMGLTMRKVQKLVPDDVYPEQLLKTIDKELREIQK